MKVLAHWRIQRLSAVLLIPLLIWLLISLSSLAGFHSQQVQEWLGQPLNSVLLWLTVGIGFFHAQLGLQVILEDYVANQPQRKRLNGLLVATIVPLWLLLTVALLVNLLA